jgi:hypothetical protein
MLKWVAVSLGAIVALLALVIALQPAAFAIERSALVRAPPDAIYPRIESLRAMNTWSPFALGDPQMKIVYSGPESGVGAMSAWESAQMGKGSMTVTAVKPNEQVDLRLEFLAPMKATNRALFSLAPEGDSTRVTWRMEGTNGFLGKAFSLFMGMDEVVGGEFEKGLASLKAQIEGSGAQAARPAPLSANAAPPARSAARASHSPDADCPTGGNVDWRDEQ